MFTTLVDKVQVESYIDGSMKRFNDYSNPELLILDNEQINDAIRIEAIEQGIQPPIPISDAVRKSEWRGYERPAEFITVYEIVSEGKYSQVESTGVAYLTKEEAEKALDGYVFIWEETYSENKGWKMKNVSPSIAERKIGVEKSKQKWAALEEFTQITEEFDKVMEACIERLSRVRQEDYNKRVNAEKKAEYLRLAGGDEEIAKRFWNKAERNEWPEEEVQAVLVQP